MNTVFRTVYNAVTQSWVAVSEKTNTQGKKASTAVCLSSSFSGSLKKMRFSLLAAALLGVFAVGEANAATGDSNHNCYYNSMKKNFRCGSENETSAQNASIFGWNNKVNHDNKVTQLTEYISIAGYENTVNNYANNINNSHHVSITGTQNTVSGENITASGNSNTITKASNSSAFGAENAITANQATAAGYQNAIKGGSSVAVGYKNITNSAYDTAVGSENKITGSNSVALGDSNIIYGNTSIAIGYNNKAGQGNYNPSSSTLGNAKYSHNIIIGDYNQAYSRNGVVIGTYSTIPASEQGTIANAATALGFNTRVSVQEGVALGAFSHADRSPGTFGKAPDSTELTSAYLGENHTNDNTGAWKSTAGALAIGNKNATFTNTNYYESKTGVVTRQITGVAAGSEDTDAVNVAQLKELQNSIGTGGGGSFSPITVNSDSGNFSVSSGGNLKIAGGNNITTRANGGTLTIDADLSGYATQQWVGQQGYLKNADLNGYATQQWVGQQGYLKNADLNGYATQTWVNNKGYQTAQQVETTITGKGYQTAQQVGNAIDTKLQGNATQQWVQQQGYLTNATLNGYATQTWVNNKGYQTAQQVETTITGKGYQNAQQVGAAIDSKLQGNATQQWVQQQGYLTNATLNGYATQSWVGQQGYQNAQQVGAAIDSKLQGNATQQWVGQQGYLKNADLNGYATQTWVNNKGYQTAQQVETTITGKGYQNAQQVGAAIDSKLQGNATQQWVGEQGYLKNADLNGYATQNWVEQQGYLKNADLNGYATQQWVGQQGYQTATQVGNAIDAKLQGNATQQWVQQQGYLKNADLNGYATQTALNTEVNTLNTRIDNLALNSGSYSPINIKGDAGNGFQAASGSTVNIQGGKHITTTANGNTLTIDADLTGYATEQFVTDKGYQTQAEVNALINGKGYTTQQWVEEQGYLTAVDKTELEEKIKAGGVDLSDYSTTTQTQQWVKEQNYQTEKQVTSAIDNKLKGYATEDFVTGQGYQTAADVENTLKGKGYQTQSEVNALINGKNFATQQWVGEQGYLKNADLNGYATEEFVTNQGYQTAADVEKTVTSKGYQTQAQVDTAINNSLQGNATQQWVEEQEYAKQTAVNHLDEKLSNLVVTSGAYAPITLTGDKNENGVGLQMQSNGTVEIVGDDNQNITTEVSGGKLKVKLADEISVNQVNVGNGGVALTADGNQSLSFGAGNTVTGTQSLAMGTGLTVSGNNSGAIGDPTVVTGDNAYSIGNNNNISTDNTYALGSNINATAANSVFLGDNAAYTAAGNSTAGLDAYATNDSDIGTIAAGSLQFAGGGTPAGVVSVGSVGSERRIQNVAAGKLSADSTDAVNGSQLYSVAEQVSQVANGGAGVVQYADENGVANGGIASNDVTVVGVNPNAPVVIHNVSAGARPTDAVNVAQLQHSMAMSEARLNNRIDRVEKRANAGTAAAMAAGNLQNAMKPGGNSFSISGATFAGEAGYAMGYSTMSSDGKWGFNAFGNGDSRGRFGGGASVGFHW